MKNFLYPVLLLAGLFFAQIQSAASSHSGGALPDTRMDVTPPEFACPGGTTTLCTYIAHQNFTTFVATWPTPSATDDSGQVTVVQVGGPISGVTYLTPDVTYIVTYKATDPSGNFTFCSFFVKLDDQYPELTYCPGNLTVCSPTEPWPLPTATDNCGFTYYIQFAGPVSGMDALIPGVVYTVRYRFYDRFANQSSDCIFTVSLESEPPVFSNCPGNLTMCSPTEPWPVPTATDNCGQVSFVQVAGPVSGVDALVPGVVYTVGYRATDLAGNSATCYFTVSIDGKPPTATCSNQTLTFNGQNSIPLDANALVTATDDCGIQSITLSPAAITCAQIGQIIPVTATVTDINGNTTTCASNITVNGLPCGWSQNPNGVNCPNGSSVGFNPGTGIWTLTSTNCYYANPFTTDALAFAQRSLCGNGSITVEVTGISGSALGWAGVIMRESNAAGAKKAQLMTNLSNPHRREFRTTTNGPAYLQQFPSQNRYWLRLERTGSQFSLYASSDGQGWYLVGAQNIVMSSCIQIGLVATNYLQTGTVSATFANVIVSGSAAPFVGPGEEHTGVQGTPDQLEFSVFPNPTSGELNIDLAHFVGKAVRLEIYSLQGQLLQVEEIEAVQTVLEQLDLLGQSNGMYIVKLKSEGLPDATRRIVLTR